MKNFLLWVIILALGLGGQSAPAQYRTLSVSTNAGASYGNVQPQSVSEFNFYQTLYFRGKAWATNDTFTASQLTLAGAANGGGHPVTNLSFVEAYDTMGNIRYGLGAGTNQSGVFNVLVGEAAGANAGKINSSVFIGANAGESSGGNTNEVAIGLSAGQATTNAGQSVFVGQGAGSYSSGGRRSVFIGARSGEGIMSASNSVFLGFLVGAYTTRAKTLMIEGVTPYSTNGSPLIYGEFDNRLLKLAGKYFMTSNGLYLAENTLGEIPIYFSGTNIVKGAWRIQPILIGTSTNIGFMQFNGTVWLTNSTVTSSF